MNETVYVILWQGLESAAVIGVALRVDTAKRLAETDAGGEWLAWSETADDCFYAASGEGRDRGGYHIVKERVQP